MSSSQEPGAPPRFEPRARVVVVAGKGGAGKTTIASALAYLGAASGIDVLIVEVEGKSGLPELFGHTDELAYDEVVLLEAGAAGPGSGTVRARTLTPDDALEEYLDDRGLGKISRRLKSTGTLDVIATAVPGIKDILVLGKVKQIEVAAASSGSPGLIVVDAPAAGHAVTFLSSAYGLIEAAAVGPIRTQAADVAQMLSDPLRCQVMLVTLAEETPVNEAAETAFHLEDRAGVKLTPVVVNGIWPRIEPPGPLNPAHYDLSDDEYGRVEAALAFRLARQAGQAEQLLRLAELLPLEQLRVPYLFTTDLSLESTRTLALALGRELESAAR